MANNAIHWVLAGIFLFLWFHVGLQGYYAAEGGGISTGWMLTSVLTVALLRK